MRGCETTGAGGGSDPGDLVVVVETPHVTVVWDGLEEVKQLSSSLGQILSSSCIPAVSTVGRQPSNLPVDSLRLVLTSIDYSIFRLNYDTLSIKWF